MKTKNKKGNVAVIAFIVAIVAISAGVFGYTFANKKQSLVEMEQKNLQVVPEVVTKDAVTNNASLDEENWKIYESAKMGFSVKYPVDYEAKINEDDSSPEPLFSVRNNTKDTNEAEAGPYPYYAFMLLDVQPGFLGGDPDKFQSPEEWAENEKKNGVEVKKETIGGNVVYSSDTTTPGGQGMKSNLIFLKKGDKYDMYNFLYKKSDVGQQILSTFKFTDSATMESYENKEFSFKLNIPQEWKGYKTFQENHVSESGEIYIYFMIPTSDKKWPGSGGNMGYADIFAITASDKQSTAYKKYLQKCVKDTIDCNNLNLLLAENQRYAFWFSHPQAAPDDDKFEGTSFEIVKSNFSLR